MSSFLNGSYSFINQYDVRKVFELSSELGRGTFSVVRLGIRKKTGEKYAVKIINKNTATASVRNMLDTEIRILQKVNHPNIIGLDSIYEIKTHLFLVMEYVEGGELFDRIVEKGSFSEADAAVVIKQILSAVKYLHDNGIVHRDLKPENVLCATKDGLEVKIADFGLSKIMRNKKLQTCCGTPNYAAPELLLCEGYGETVDLWSVGVMLYVLLSGCLPFFGETHNELFKRIMDGAFYFPSSQWADISDTAKSLVLGLLTVDPKKRLKAEDALHHPWLSVAPAHATSIPGLPERMNQFNILRHTDSTKYVVPEATAVPQQANPIANIYENKDNSTSEGESDSEYTDANSDDEYESDGEDSQQSDNDSENKETKPSATSIVVSLPSERKPYDTGTAFTPAGSSTLLLPTFSTSVSAASFSSSSSSSSSMMGRRKSKKVMELQALSVRAGSQKWEDLTDWAKLAAISTVVKCSKDQVVLKEGHQNRDFFRIKSGSVRVMKKRADGAKVVLHTLTAGTMFGEISMLQPSGVVTASVVADEGAELYQLSAAQIKQLFEQDFDLAERFYRNLAVIQAQRMAHIRNRIEELIGPNAVVNTVVVPIQKNLQTQFTKLFALKSDEICIAAYPCRWKGTLPQTGTLYISQHYICSYYHFFALKHKQAIPYNIITAIEELGNCELRVTFRRKKKLEKAVLILMNETEYAEALQTVSQRWKDITSGVVTTVLTVNTSQSSTEIDKRLQDTLTTEDWEAMLEEAQHKTFAKDKPVIKEGEKGAQNLYQIARGRCRVEQQRPEDDSVITLGFIGSGEVFGEISMLRKSSTTASVVADDVTGVEIYVIPGAHIAKLFVARPGFPGRFFKYLATILSVRLHMRELELLV